MTLISYVALQALSVLSLYVNGAIGVGKMALSAVTVAKDYKAAQNLLEEGVFHILVAVADFTLASFALSRAVVALAYGAAPQKTNEYFEKIYKPWNGAIQHAHDQDAEEVRAERKAYSYLQATADAVQCLIMPQCGESRIQSALDAIYGRKD
jgi:hypothetical protein